jgi:hypothetical protein
VYYPFEKFGYIDSNFIIDPEDWYMAAKITPDGMWRVSYGELPGLTPDEVEALYDLVDVRLPPAKKQNSKRCCRAIPSPAITNS